MEQAMDWRIIEMMLTNANSTPHQFNGFDLLPRGWSLQNVVVCANLQEQIIESLASANQQITPHKIDEAVQEVKRTLDHPAWSPFKWLAAIALPSASRACKTLVQTQTKVGQARIACALERYRLAHGEYPETLAPLVPQFMDKIPNDVVGGHPPHYRRNPDGTFLLYSIGWSEQDHGGRTNLDLVWPEAQK
jgi:hypothetical protein